MKAATLLRELEPLTHTDRVQRMVALGREGQTQPAIAAALTALEAGDVYQRSLALFSCYGSADGAHVLRALADPSRSVRALALSLVALACDDAQALTALGNLPAPKQRSLVKRLAVRKRFTPVDAFLAALPDDQAAPLLAYASPAVVAARAEQALANAPATDWSRLARRHPRLAADLLIRRAATAPDFDQRLRWLGNAVLPILARRAPDAAVALVQRLQAAIPLPDLQLTALLQQRPNAIADLLLASDAPANLDLSSYAPRLTPDRRELLASAGRLGDPGDWLHRIAPAERTDLYRRHNLGWRDHEGALTPEIVRALPEPLRSAEARRHLALPAFQTRPITWFRYAAALPWDEARAALEPFVRHPDPTLRAFALPALIDVARFQREYLPAALQLVRDRRNEQDPVRQAMLGALAALPPARWRAEHLPELGQAVRDALDAADCSASTALEAQRLVIALLPFHPAWAVAWLATLARERGMFGFYGLEHRLTPADVQAIAPALLPVLEAWEPREREQAIFQAAALFGRRLEHFPGLVALLERLTHDRRAWVAARALNLLATYSRDRLPVLIPALLREDPSWATQPVVYTYLHRRRQDLLTPFLKRTSYRGRFTTGNTVFIFPFTDGFHRWTPAQQAAFARLLEQLTADEARDNPALFQAINQLAALPAVAPERIIALAAADAPRPALRDVALRALGRLDSGAGIPELLVALDDDRARIAIYSLRRALLELPPAQARTTLLAVPLRRVTVAKEVVRLLGDLPGDVAYPDLLALAGETLHRDVRIALLRALWNHLERDATWPILEAAGNDADPAVAAGVIRIPAERISPTAQRRLMSLLARLLSHPAPQVRLDVLNRCATLPVSDAEQQLRAPLLAALASPMPDERRAAANAALATYVGQQAAAVGAAVAALKPNAQALSTLIGALSGRLYWHAASLRPTVAAVINALADDPRTANWQAALAVNGLAWPDTIAVLRRLAAADELHAEATIAAVHAVAERAGRTAAGLADLEAAFRTEADPHLRRMALAALIGLSQPPRGWNAERRRLLERYRSDPAPLVAAVAWCTFPNSADAEPPDEAP